jgi:hypothetical protein
MSYNGSGTFQINTSGQPVVTGTVISSSAFNALTADLATGLSTAITKDGQTTTTARIPFAAGINSSLVTDSSSTSTGSIITAGGVGIAKALYVGTTANIAGASTFTGAIAVDSVTDSSSTTTGSIQTDGGLGVAKAVFIGTTLNVAGATTAASGSFTSLAYSTTLTGGTGIVNLGSGQFYKDASGNVSIGTTTSNGRLTIAKDGVYGTPQIVVNGATNANQTLQIGYDTTSNYGYIQPLLSGTGYKDLALNPSGGNVGIGTSSPSSQLTIQGSAPITRYDISGVGTLSVGFNNSGGTLNNIPTGVSAVWMQQAYPLIFATNGTERMRIDSSGNLLFNSGYGSVATAYGCRAWVNFNGTGTVAIRASGNVSSITDSGVGLYDVNFTTAMPDANYAPVVTAYSANSSLYAVGGQVNGQAPTTAKFRIAVGAGASFGADTTAGYADLPHVFASVFR